MILRPSQLFRFREQGRSLPLTRTLDDGDVAVDRQIGKSLDLAAGLRPLDLQPIDFRTFPDAQHNARIVRRKITASADFDAVSLQISGLLGDPRAQSHRDSTSCR